MTYIPLRRNGFYFIEDQKYVSVTTVLNVLSKPALVPWASRRAAVIALEDPSLSVDQVVSKVYGIRDTAGNIGSTIHSWIEAKKKGASLDYEKLPEDLRGYGKAFDSFRESFKGNTLSDELTVLSKKYGYAGTLDEVIEDTSKNICLLDYKTSKGVYDEYGIQLSAYSNAYTEMGNKVNKQMVVHLKPNGTFTLIEFNEPFSVFLAALDIWKWMNLRGELRKKEVKEK